MKANRVTALLLAAGFLLLAGCTLSLNPIHSENDLVHDPALVGTWAGDTHEDGVWTFERRDADPAYQLVVKNGQGAARFRASLVQLGQHRFLDLLPDEDAHEAALDRAGLDGVFRGSYVPGHWIYRVVQLEPVLQLAALDDEWVKALQQREPGATPHCRLSGDNDRIVLTGSTAELQAFLRQHADSPGAFIAKEQGALRRQPTARP